MFRFIFKFLRTVFLAAIAAAVAAKFVLESHGGPETEEIDLVAIFDGKNLISSADPFYGGHILAMFGGVKLDLRKTHPAPTGVRLDVTVAMSGLSIIVPEGWRVFYEGDTFLGGFSDETKTTADEDVPSVTIAGRLVLGGIQVSTKPAVEAVAR